MSPMGMFVSPKVMGMFVSPTVMGDICVTHGDVCVSQGDGDVCHPR